VRGVNMSGFLAIKRINPSFALSVKALIGIDLRKNNENRT